MPKIKGWKLINKKYHAWQNEESGRVITSHYEPDWEVPWQIELYKGYVLFGNTVIGEDSIDTIGYYPKKSLALSGAVRWMREHPKG